MDPDYLSQQRILVASDHLICLQSQNEPDLEKMSQEASKSCTQIVFWRLGQQGITAHDQALYRSLDDWIGITPGNSDESDLESGGSEGKSEDMGVFKIGLLIHEIEQFRGTAHP
jgi:hypothetical protein